MEERIPAAAVYPWAPGERQISPQPPPKKRKGSGFAVLHQALDDTKTSKRAKEILKDLLNGDSMEGTVDESHLLATTALSKPAPAQQENAIDPNAPMSDDQVLSMAQEGRLSLLGSIIRVVRESLATPVSTKQVLKTCVLAVRPGDVPAAADFNAKDVVIAALLFLSSTHKTDYWTLPVIRPTQDEPDLEKRSYELVQSPTDSQLKWLETAFLSSADKYLPRVKYCPRLDKDEEDPLLRKGLIPPGSLPQTAAAKRKATLAAKAASAS